MLSHLIRLIWNKKKQNFLLILEIFLSFIGLCAAFTFVLYPYNNYKLPSGIVDENVWLIDFNSSDEIKNTDSLIIFRESIKRELLSMSQVEEVTYCSNNTPFSGNSSNTDIRYNGNRIFAMVYAVEDNYLDVLGVKLSEGRWLRNDDNIYKERPVVINEKLKTEFFGDTNPIGKILESDVLGNSIETGATHKMKVVGVVKSFKHESEFEMPSPGFFLRMDTNEMRHHVVMMLKVKPGADAAFEGTVHKTLSNSMAGANIEIRHLTDMRSEKNKKMIVPFTIFCIIAGFLIINVALGIFGVLWYNINKRRSEMGLRRAVGATGSAISRQLVAEAILIATLALIIGSLFAIQFPLLNLLNLPAANYVTAIIMSIIFIYALVITCAWYPGRQASGIYPATALHED